MQDAISEISVEEAKKKWEAKSATFLDIRDPGSFAQAHIPDAIPMDQEKAEEIIQDWDKEKELIICCYHGNTSYGVAGYFMENGFKNVASLSGGFELWRTCAPITH